MNAANPITTRRGALALAAAAGVVFSVSPVSAQSSTAPPAEVTLIGVVRDFRASNQSGHPDFQRQPTAGFGHYMNMVQNNLDTERKPIWLSAGYRVTGQWKDAQGRNRIKPKPYLLSMPGDVNGSHATSTGGACTTAANFSQWFRDTPGVNMSDTLPMTLKLEPGTDKYVFDDKQNPVYVAAGGFFPINGNLYGNYSSTGKNYHFTYELETTFTYEEGTGAYFRFIGDDDVWVFIDDKLCIDIGGVHSAVEQTVNVDRMGWLEPGRVYALKFFFAERHTSQSNFRIETTLNLVSVAPPSTTALYD